MYVDISPSIQLYHFTDTDINLAKLQNDIAAKL